MALFILELLFYTWSRVQCVRLGYELSGATDKQKQLVLLQNNLKTEVARLKSPGRIAKIAKNRLDLIMPKPNQMIVIP
ncbi:MAG: septum formation initiator family protein [Deltaproteobacteria bacterium]|nr:septum formation initiator family protein [Deltaproteobacteria bacterium]